MTTKFSLLFIIVVLLISCSSGDDAPIDINLAPSAFNVTVSEISADSAVINWTASTDPEKKSIFYEIYLNNILLESNSKDLTYTFENLSGETSYNGKVIASDGINSTVANFTFTTEVAPPLIYTGYVSLSTQQEVIDFGNKHYNIINGHLVIQSLTGKTTDISDLSPLSDITEVYGYVRIQQTSLVSLQGLNNLNAIGDDLNINNNEYLKNLNGLEGLHTIAEDLLIYGNNLLEETSAIGNLKSFDGSLNISNNPALVNLYLSEYIEVLNGADIYDNASLESIKSFNKVKKVNYQLSMSSNANLSNIDFSGLETVGSYLYLNNTQINDMSGFSSLIEISGHLELMDNNLLTSLDGLSSLTKVGARLNIWNNEMLSDFCDITDMIKNNGLSGDYSVMGNSYNPTKQDILDDNCSQ